MKKIVVVLALLAMMVSLRWLEVEPTGGTDPLTLAAIGFGILAAFAVADLLARVGLPKVTGYLLTGLVLGPQVGGILSPTVIEKMTMFNTLALGTIALMSILAVILRSPLEEPANALVTPNPAKAPWYFLWLQEIVTDTTVRIGSFTINGAFIGGVILPGILVGLLTIWPWLDRSPAAAAGRWFPKDRRTQNLAFLVLTLLILALTFVGTFMRGPYWQLYWPWEAWPDIPARI